MVNNRLNTNVTLTSKKAMKMAVTCTNMKMRIHMAGLKGSMKALVAGRGGFLAERVPNALE